MKALIETLERIYGTSMGQLQELPAADLKDIGDDLQALYEKVRLAKQWWENALKRKYEAEIVSIRSELGKDTGVIHVYDGDYNIMETRPKKVEWDNTKLETMAKRIESAGENPKEYMEIQYSIAESKYANWPEHLKESFEAARILKAGKPTFKIIFKGDQS